MGKKKRLKESIELRDSIDEEMNAYFKSHGFDRETWVKEYRKKKRESNLGNKIKRPYIIEKRDGIFTAKRNESYWKEMAEKRYNILLAKSGIPKNYADIEFENYVGKESTESLNKCVQYVNGANDEKFHNVNLYLVGTYGTQKTMIACNIGKSFIRQGYKVQFSYASEFIDLIMKTQGFNYIEEIEDKIKKITGADLIIIDDIFDQDKGTYWKNSPELVISAWDKFLRRIISEDKRVILTSNHGIEVIKTKFGRSLYHLIERNFISLSFHDSISETRKSRFKGLWE